MLYCIFRKSDKEMLYNSFTKEEDDSAWKSCLENEGGVANDYIRVSSLDLELTVGKNPALNDLDELVLIDNPKIVDKQNRRTNARDKLTSLVPGLTNQDIDDLFS